MTKMPLIRARVEAHDGDMTTDQLPRSASHDRRRLDRWLARVRAPSLDQQLAAGRPAAAGLLALRAREIASPAGRREIARGWEHVLHQAARPPVPRTPRAPLCRDRITAAEPDVRDMLAVLRGPVPVTVRGAALASSLLSDGTGPLHNLRSRRGLDAAVREATRLMTAPSPWPGDWN